MHYRYGSITGRIFRLDQDFTFTIGVFVMRALYIFFFFWLIIPLNLSLAEEGEELSLHNLLNLAIEVSSTKPETIFNTPSSVSIIDKETIETYDFKTLSEAIETLAGVTVGRTFFARDIPTFRGILQDHYVNKILILLDGVPTFDPITGHGSFDRINIKDLERIEVLKGPASVLYGTNAYVGAINLVLKKSPAVKSASSESGALRGGIGTENRQIGSSGHFLYTDEKVSYFVASSLKNEAGFLYPDKNQNGKKGFFTDEEGKQVFIRDFEDRASATMKLGYNGLGGTHTILLNAFDNKDSFLGSSPLLNNGIGNPQSISGSLVNYHLALPFTEKATIHFAVTYENNSREFSQRLDNQVKARMVGSRQSTIVYTNVDVFDFFSVEIGGGSDTGASSKFEIFDPVDQENYQDNILRKNSVRESSFYNQYSFSGDKLSNPLPVKLLVGIRLTKNEAFKDNTSTRSSLVLKLSETSSLKAGYGQSFRAPSLYELYYRDSAAVNEIYGNPDLKPETSDTLELSYLQSFFTYHFIQMTVYRSVYHDKIIRTRRYPDSTSDLSEIFSNGEDYSASGVEFEFKFAKPRTANIDLSYDQIIGTDSKQKNMRSNFKYVPKQTATLGIGRKFTDITLSTVGNFYGKREGDHKIINPDYTADVSLLWGIKSGQHGFSVKNVTDHQIRIPDHIRGNINHYYSGYGRTFLYEFSKKF
ncbi:MAG: TonB-dependent receptor [Oligoflexales bacterium]|nr:TonB-dependent receptor [Oligoflexales bacterium]